MSEALARLEAASRELESADDEEIDPGRLAKVIDGLQGKLCRVVHRGAQRDQHLRSGMISACGWVAATCRMSRTSAADRLCVGKQLEALPGIAQALGAGEIGYQAASVICHLAEQLGEKRELIDEAAWVGFARRFSIQELRYLSHEARLHWDPEGFDRDGEEDYEQRYLHLSPLGRMYKLDALLDHEAGAALKTALDALSKPHGRPDERTPKQRRADALSAIVHHAMDQGSMPRRNRARPHLLVHTSLEALEGVGASSLECGGPVSSQTVRRLACDCALSRVVKAGSVVVDVGRATRAISGPQWRALKGRHQACAFPGCDRPLSWTNGHHVEFWSRGGRTDLRDLLPLCYYHHRLVHEGGWQVIRSGDVYRWIPPERPWRSTISRRWGELAA